MNHVVFLYHDWLPTEAQKLSQVARQKIDDALGKVTSGLSHRHVETWGSDGGPDEIGRHLSRLLRSDNNAGDTTVVDPVIGDIVKLWDLIKQLSVLSGFPAGSSNDRLYELVRDLKAYGSLLDPAKLSSSKAWRQRILAFLSSLEKRLDTWLISEIVGLDPDMRDNPSFGYVAALRRFSLLPIARIEIDKATWYSHKEHYYRVCRLRPSYRSDLVQKFAHLFTRVGLDDQRSGDHARARELCARHLFPDEEGR